MSAAHTPMALAAGRALADRAAVHCSINADDNWKVYGEDFIEDAEFALNAAGAPELLDIAKRIDALLTGQRWNPEGDAPEALLLRDARAAIKKATGAAT